MNYKMFVCDLDGTLLDNNHKITKENLKAIKELEASGVKFVVATGRSIHMLEDYLEILDYKRPIIWSNGAGISSSSGELLYTREVSSKKAKELIEITKKYNQDYVIYTIDGVVGNNIDGRMGKLYKYNENLKDKYKIPLKIDKNLEDNLENYRILKVSLNSNNDEKLEELRKIMEKVEGISAVYSHKSLLDLTHKEANKGDAMIYLANKYNIDLKEVVAIGDNHNDLSMLSKAGLSITLDNASYEVKNKVMKITNNNHDSGVAFAIRNFVIKDNI